MGRSRSAVQSRFGLRMILVFATCSLLPIILFATFAHLRTRAQLEASAVAALRRESKDVSMRLVERLATAADELEHAIVSEHATPGIVDQAFHAVEIVAESAVALDAKQRAALDAGRTVLVLHVDGRDHPLQILHRDPRGGIHVGTLRLESILPSEENLATQRYWIESERGELIHYSDDDGETSAVVATTSEAAPRARLNLTGSEGAEIGMIWPVYLHGYLEGEDLRVGSAVPRDAILAPLDDFESAFLAAFGLGLLGSIAIALHQVRRRIGPLEDLNHVARAVEAGDYTARAALGSGDEFDDVARSFNAMTSEVAHHVANLQQLAQAGAKMLRETTLEAVSSHLAVEALSLTGAALGLVFRGRSRESANPVLPRAIAAHQLERGAIPIDALGGLVLDVPDGNVDAPFLLEREHDRSTHAGLWDACESLVRAPIEGVLVVPLRTGEESAQTFLVLATRRPAADSPWQGRSFHAVRILADQGAVAIRVVELVANLRALFEGVIHLTVQAIDEKSPYTGDHCRRVPVLTEQIADAVDRVDSGPLKDFRLTAAERYELRIASLLHDCGKVATPVHVMDKATKLETIMDRMEVVHGRAEIVRRDLELTALRRMLSEAGLAAQPTADSIAPLVARLDDDLAFVEKCNQGGEFMDPAARARIDEIHERHAWQDRSGAVQRLLTEAERENLKIGRGTLNASERGVIEEHASTTIRLLERLPFPPEMARVPYIAGSHHERLDGTGYPNGLAAADLNVQARILGLADVFEALTAKDRPYKPGRTLSQTIRILEAMVGEGHIDGELLDVMLKSKVHLRYASEYMDPEQIDDVFREELENLTAPWEERADPY